MAASIEETLAKIRSRYGTSIPEPQPIQFSSGRTGLFQVPSRMIDSEISFSPTVAVIQRQFNRLATNIRSFKEPLERAITQVMSPSFRRNFDVGGRPRWAPLSDFTIKEKARLGYGSNPLIRTGTLREVAGQKNIWTIEGGYQQENARAYVKGMPQRAWYGTVHQSGVRSLGKQMRDVIVFGSGDAQLPERPFIVAQQEDLKKVQQIFDKYYEERINRDLPLRGGR